MNVAEKLVTLLQCPNDESRLKYQKQAFQCAKCGRLFPFSDGIFTCFHTDEGRPATSQKLSQEISQSAPDLLTADYYKKRLKRLQSDVKEKEFVKRFTGILPGNADAVVDIATGPGGGFIPWLTSELSADTLLIATDACVPVVKNWNRVISEVRDEFAFLDVDLQKTLCFQNDSIDAFTGIAIENVNLSEPMGLFAEVARCTKPKGIVMLQQLVFAENSKTARMLNEKNNPYSSLSELRNAFKTMQIIIEEHWDIRAGKGRLHPSDGLPIDENDEWKELIIIARKS